MNTRQGASEAQRTHQTEGGVWTRRLLTAFGTAAMFLLNSGAAAKADDRAARRAWRPNA